MAPASAEKVNVALLSVVVAGGPEAIVASGGVMSASSTVQFQVAGDASMLPSASMARTAKVCGPTVIGGVPRSTSGYRTGDSHSAKAAPSRLHSKVGSRSVPVKVNVALVLVVDASGPDVIVVSGGTATVHSCSAGVSSTSPFGCLATTSNVWAPSIRPL